MEFSKYIGINKKKIQLAIWEQHSKRLNQPFNGDMVLVNYRQIPLI